MREEDNVVDVVGAVEDAEAAGRVAGLLEDCAGLGEVEERWLGF